MRILIIGLGSMGKRRVRNMKALGIADVYGFDLREDRKTEAREKYNIVTFDNINIAFESAKPDAVIISVSPKYHMEYAAICQEKNIPCFIEASVTDRLKIETLAKDSKGTGWIAAPSCTMRFYPGPKKVKELLTSGVIGKPLSVNYHTGQYLPDWHPWEAISEYYVSERETGGAREIVPFELTWINDLFGTPEAISCIAAKLTDMEADIDDIYHCLLRYPENIILNMTVEVISRPIATREMMIIGTQGKIQFSAESNSVRYCNSDSAGWIETSFAKGTLESNYINPEEPYIDEMRSFINAVVVNNQLLYPNNLENDAVVLKVLEDLEAKNSWRPL
jgi:predicted dehydrogenase